MFIPDLLHEFELGVWKATFIHLIRVLYAYGHDTIQALNKRYEFQPLTNYFDFFCADDWYINSYRQVPMFGRGTIHKFSSNASGMKKLAARDFEDLLQVHFYAAVPVQCTSTDI